jgi:hypothetical protein
MAEIVMNVLCGMEMILLVWREIGLTPDSPSKFASAYCEAYFAGVIFG